ncbi:cytoplasmic phosphatidylinositol transfer protein 1b [Myripristis murdjan]|uniref:Phosphatidylinositol transfer protein cytoplasmic 1b n=1 Tax=Myripristis murdjan TaxID=586833 RepID=A0A667XQZ6_9TELE|nr:cytoplasmic phosphatidylinositol transfer protein 1-like [Myripristis murdjan]XP_029929095.1 cytoplasmic phosphatidylinositol transfer protein 1-like [Myripristis murdjan]XP_029929097.1 cytoplasmic phosphatidylinositol transfer protein 1-like [Myripristis murdjan]
MLMKEYRICMPLTVDEYRIGQLYMISKHSCEQSGGGEGVEVVRNEADTHPQHGLGQLTEKRIYLSSKLPSWAKAFVPRFFYVTEKAWNFYPYTLTEYSVSFLPKFSIRIETRFENNNGSNNNVFGDKPTPTENVSFLDILSDPIPEKYYKESEDLSHWQSSKTGRGPLEEGWREHSHPIMCSYKRVQCSFEVYGFQGRTEDFIHRNIRDILLVGHRQAVAWTDEWHGMNMEEVREYEQKLQEKTNKKVKSSQSNAGPPATSRPVFSRSMSVTDERSLMRMGVTTAAMSDPSTSSLPQSPVRLNSTPE